MTGLRHFGVDLLPDAVRDMDALPDAVRSEALAALWDVARGRIRGHPLGARPDQGLEQCRRLYLGHSGWRLVYIETPRAHDAVGMRGILIVAVGPRARGAVYDTAATRLRTRRDAVPADRATAARAARMRPGPITGRSAAAVPPSTPALTGAAQNARPHRPRTA